MALTQKALASMAPGDVLHDTKVVGLHARAGARGVRFYLYFRIHGRERRPKIGDASVLSLPQARAIARQMLADVAEGRDPAESRRQRDERPTLEKLAEWHIERHARPKTKTADEQASRWQRHVLPALGASTAVADVTRADIAELHHAMRATPYEANRTAAMLHKAFSLAIDWGWIDTNPVRVEHYREKPRKRYPVGDEPARLIVAMEEMRPSHPHFIGLVALLILTGARLTEIQHARWKDVRSDGLYLADSKGGERVIPLSRAARQVLDEIPRVDRNEYIIVGRRKGRPLVNITKPWKRLCKAAEIEGLRPHDLRRFFASASLSAGATLHQVGQLLGHSQIATTQRYAFLMVDAQTAGMEAAAKALQDRMNPGED